MSESRDVEILVVDSKERDSLVPILEESFEGIYLRHSKRTLRESELVKVARIGGENAGLVMLKELGRGIGYIYYIAVSRKYRRQGIAGKLLDNSLGYFIGKGNTEAYASVEADNDESMNLFLSRGFRETKFGEVSKRHGHISATFLYTKMWVVPGEHVYVKDLSPKLQ